MTKYRIVTTPKPGTYNVESKVWWCPGWFECRHPFAPYFTSIEAARQFIEKCKTPAVKRVVYEE